ncbi:MAG: peptidylprolyl isomerase [Holophagaceae bacterium]
MTPSVPSFQKLAVCALVALAVRLPAQEPVPRPRFAPADAVRAEWARQAPEVAPEDRDLFSEADEARFVRTLKRIGAPGCPDLLPPELDKPTEEAWVAKAKEARTPQERFTALHFLNRLKSRQAFLALEGLAAEDAKAWPAALHLEHAVATARINGSPAPPSLRVFLNGLAEAGKIDEVRIASAQLRLVLAGVEKVLLDPLPPTPGAVLAMMDAWNRATPEQRQARPGAEAFLEAPAKHLQVIGLKDEVPSEAALTCLMQRWFEGLPEKAPLTAWPVLQASLEGLDDLPLAWRLAAVGALGKFTSQVDAIAWASKLAERERDPRLLGALLPSLRRLSPDEADGLRERLLMGKDPVARAAALEDCPRLPGRLTEFLKLVWNDPEIDAFQALVACFKRWGTPPEVQAALLKPSLQHPAWIRRYEAWKALRAFDPDLPWPAAPKDAPADAALRAEAEALAEKGGPVRLRVTYEGGRSLVMRLDPTVAPINVANLARLARKGYFDGQLVPRVVPDFVVQMGSPLSTMDGGPGYAVRCENSLDWYGPGSVGMALSGKDTGGSQFFITTNATPHLTGRYTRLGEVEDPERALPLLDALELNARLEKVEVLAEGKSPVPAKAKPAPKARSAPKAARPRHSKPRAGAKARSKAPRT